jgi:hypothetical protein
MGASLEIFGVNYKKIVEDYPGYFKNSQKVSVEELKHLYYEILFDKSDSGLELFFENGIKRYCFTIHEMMTYFFSSFNWNNDVELGRHPDGPHYILTKSQVIGLIDWYIALTYEFSDDDYVIDKIKEPKYLEEAKRMIDYYDDPNDENYFKISGYDFVELKEEFLNAHYDCYFYTYSF